MALKTTLEKLEAVQDAIAKAELVQSAGMSGTSITRGALNVLYAREEKLLQQLAVEQGRGAVVNTGILRRD